MRFVACLVIASVTWVPLLHLWFRRTPDVGALAARQLAVWEGDPGPHLAELRRTNPEWDLMTRTFAVLAFANLAREQPALRARYLAAIDTIIDRTLADVERVGVRYFLLPYGRDATHSIFVDGELALMIATRNTIAPGRDASVWVARSIAAIEAGPALLAESYPDEVWLFCNTVALAAVRIHDTTEGVPDRHAALFARWVAHVRATVVDRETGLLAAKTGHDGSVREGPEGSTLWLAATMLRHVDDDFARDQYARTRAALRRGIAGFGWAREWPAGRSGSDDVDSGPTIPIVGANAGSSGLALVAARAFGDTGFARELTTSLAFAGFPDHGRYAAGNLLADAIVVYAESLP